jgi:monooxygenase
MYFIAFGSFAFWWCRTFKRAAQKVFLHGVTHIMGSTKYAAHFTPTYFPWEQRVCLCPDGDFFQAIKSNKAIIVTANIERITSTGVQLVSGGVSSAEAVPIFLHADVLVTATGLNLCFLGKITISIDGKAVVAQETRVYRGAMLSGVPNLFFLLGYTNASWTLKVGVVCSLILETLQHMDARTFTTFWPTLPAHEQGGQPIFNLAAGYLQRGDGLMPKQGTNYPWRYHHNYLLDVLDAQFRGVGTSMRFT